MSQQTQPQQKQPESLRRGVNISNRTSGQSAVTHTTRLNNEGNEFDFYESHYETKKYEKG
jgi:hypothetical protein